jgi:hypothetical protein
VDVDTFERGRLPTGLPSTFTTVIVNGVPAS